MDRKESGMKKLDDELTELFEQAHRNPELKRELLRNPEAVAERFGVKLKDEEVQQLQKLGTLSELAEEIKYGRLFPRPPIFYPIDVWRINELLNIFSHLIPGDIITYPGPGPIFYPAQPIGRNAMFATRAYNPDWVTYPGEQGSGKGGGSYAVRLIPGPIFYPAGLHNLLKERLSQILQIRQRFAR